MQIRAFERYIPLNASPRGIQETATQKKDKTKILMVNGIQKLL